MARLVTERQRRRRPGRHARSTSLVREQAPAPPARTRSGGRIPWPVRSCCWSSRPGARSASTRVAARRQEREPGALAGRRESAGSKHTGDSRNRGKGGQLVWPITTPDRRGRGDAHLWRMRGARRRGGQDALLLPHGYHERGAVAGRVRRASMRPDGRRNSSSSMGGFMARSVSPPAGRRRGEERGTGAAPPPSAPSRRSNIHQRDISGLWARRASPLVADPPNEGSRPRLRRSSVEARVRSVALASARGC